ncbi:Unknown protein [Striga hermonthica]|uniref:Uncharacterized protein n=1 Tax=Striga hermonthica TaxID=68872 RepID=A0A9N7REB5_STRHE|nr:Unknown protein [Striga hermonthica]
MSPFRDPPAEVINAWELMAGRKSLKSGTLTSSLTGIEPGSSMKFLSQEGTKKPSPRLWASIKGSSSVKRSESMRFLSGRRILGLLFDLELLAEFEREVSEEEEPKKRSRK